MENQKQISIVIAEELHRKYRFHAMHRAKSFKTWVLEALENQFKTDNKKKK